MLQPLLSTWLTKLHSSMTWARKKLHSFSHSIVFISVNIFIAFICHCFLFFSVFRHKCFLYPFYTRLLFKIVL